MKSEWVPNIVLVSAENIKWFSSFEANLRLLKILEPLSDRLTWISINCLGNESKLPQKVNWVKFYSTTQGKKQFASRLLSLILHQVKIIQELKKANADVFLFWYGGEINLVVTFLYAALFLRKKIILKVEGRSSIYWREQYTYASSNEKVNIKAKVVLHSITEKAMYSLADRIAVQFAYMIEHYNMQSYKRKINLANQYVDIEHYKQITRIKDRKYLVGYNGRLSPEKGALEFVHALPAILKEAEDKAIIVGDGELKDKIKEIITEHNIQNKVDLTEWIENDRLVTLLNEMKLLIIPSFIEGIPKAAIEAMACGTPVLATHAGGMSEVIVDGNTGFLMKSNSPECIAENVKRAMNHPNIEEITQNAREFVERDFNYSITVERYRKLLNKLFDN